MTIGNLERAGLIIHNLMVPAVLAYQVVSKNYADNDDGSPFLFILTPTIMPLDEESMKQTLDQRCDEPDYHLQ